MMNNGFQQPDPKQRQRLVVAVALSAVVLIGADLLSFVVTGRHMLGGKPPAHERTVNGGPAGAPVTASGAATAPQGEASSATAPTVAAVETLQLQNSDLSAGITTQGGKIDSVTLKHYAEKLGEPAGYALMKPSGTNFAYVESGWLGNGLQGPGASTVWAVDRAASKADTVVLTWQNASGQVFTRSITLRPDNYVFEVRDRVENSAPLPVSFSHYAQVQEADGFRAEEKHSSWVNYFGPMGWVDLTKDEHRQVEDSYKDVAKTGRSAVVTGTSGWWGMTGQYFMNVVVPLSASETQRDFRHANVGGRDFYTATVQQPQVVVPPAGASGPGSAEVQYLVYSGPKAYSQLAPLGNDLEQAISWGWFEPIVKLLYHALIWLHGVLGNWGLAIIALTFGLKLLTFPLANKSYHAMAKMKKLQPRIEAMKKDSEARGESQQELAMKTMQLYQKEKVNPLGGCWPMLVQIPIFFAMYKVVLVSFEFRHAPLALWIHDMSAMDPYFVLPVLMGASMFLQMRMQPQAADPTQAAVFRWMPVLFTVMFLFFPAGLVLYWLTNNVLSISQQYVIMKRDKAL